MALKICAECQQEKPKDGCPACPEPAATEVAKFPATCSCGAVLKDGDGKAKLVSYGWNQPLSCGACA